MTRAAHVPASSTRGPVCGIRVQINAAETGLRRLSWQASDLRHGGPSRSTDNCGAGVRVGKDLYRRSFRASSRFVARPGSSLRSCAAVFTCSFPSPIESTNPTSSPSDRARSLTCSRVMAPLWGLLRFSQPMTATCAGPGEQWRPHPDRNAEFHVRAHDARCLGEVEGGGAKDHASRQQPVA
jgi:hypothetical protein